MRAAVLAVTVFLAAAAQARAQPAAFMLPDTTERAGMRVPSDAGPYRDYAGEDAAAGHVPARSSVSLGPFVMDIGNGTSLKDGRPTQFAHVHLRDVQVLGGNVSGTFDGRAATLRLSWPMGN